LIDQDFNPIDPDSSSDARFSQISSWLTECYSNHKDCDAPINQILPTRVLDLGGRHDTRGIRLLTTEGRKGQWVALSHSWGDFQPLRTTKTTLAVHQDNIELMQLPQTFQDAVIIARKLGFRYLWIDSLCIVQDSLEDWENEAATMASVYGNAALTICAEASANGQRGIFNSANERRGLGVKLPATSPPNSSRGNMWLTARSVESDGDFHVGSRAWVMQESLLSPRLISYAADQLYFSCRTARQGDQEGHMAYGVYDLDVCPLEHSTKVLLSGPMVYEGRIGKPNESRALTTTSHHRHTVSRHQLRAKMKDSLPRIGNIAKRISTLTGLSHLLPSTFSSKRDPNPSELLRVWYQIVESYAPRQITKISDRLPAIAGVAKRVSALTGLSYAAGLWEEDLIRGLCWMCRPRSRYCSTYVGPTWSWVSIVYPPGENMRSMKHLYRSSNSLSPASVVANDIKIEHVDIKYSTVDRFLGIKKGSSLRISGLCGVGYHIIDSKPMPRDRYRAWDVCTTKQQFRLTARMLDYCESPVGRDLLFLLLASSTAIETTDGETLLLILEMSPADGESYVRVGIAVVPEDTWRQVDLAFWSVRTVTVI